MAALKRIESKEDNIGDSWVELYYQQTGTTPPEASSLSRPVNHGQMEKLLLEAQKDYSRCSSLIGSQASSSRASPKSMHSPVNEPSVIGLHGLHGVNSQVTVGSRSPPTPPSTPTTDWLADWASRPEVQPPSECVSSFRHPSRHKLSVRNTPVMRGGPFSLENLPMLLVSHACTFFLGAAALFLYLRKYCKWGMVLPPTVD